MDFNFYHEKFQTVSDALDKRQLQDKSLQVAVVEVMQSVALKLYKDAWSNNTLDPLVAPSRIFFSIWVNDKTLRRNAVFYNIHALKLRHLKGYAIESRAFAESFRKKFKKVKKLWPNVSTSFGPLTLMEGWCSLQDASLEELVMRLATQFIVIEYLIDNTLSIFKRDS